MKPRLAPRQPRSQRRNGIRLDLTERDRALLGALARFRLAPTSGLTRLFFAGVRPDTAAVRLRRLFDAGYLDVTSAELHRPNYYRLGPKGRQWADQLGVAAGRAPAGGQAHHLAIVRIWTEFALLARGGQEFRLSLFRPDWELREVADRRELVVPDALAELLPGASEHPGGPIRLALEVDLGTESIRTLSRKVDSYRAVLSEGDGLFGWPAVTLILLADGLTIGRRRALEELLERRCPVDWHVWPIGDPFLGLLRQLLPNSLASPYRLPLQQGENGRPN